MGERPNGPEGNKKQLDQAAFRKNMEEMQLKQREKDAIYLAQLAEKPKEKEIYEYSLGETLVAIKDTWFAVLDDLLRQKPYTEVFKDNRVYFIGVSIVIITIGICLYNAVFGSWIEHNVDRKKVEIHYVHHVKGDADNGIVTERVVGATSVPGDLKIL